MTAAFRLAGRLAAFGALALAMAIAGCRDDDQPPPPVRPVLSVVAKPRTSEVLGPFAGSIQPRYSTDYGFRLFGRIVARPVSVGSTVQQGDELAAIDPTLQAILLRDARAAVAGAQAQFANARAEEARQKRLVERNVIPQAQYEAILQSREAAAATLVRAQASLQRAEDALSFTRLRADFPGIVTGTQADVGQVVNVGQKIVTVARPDIREAVIAVPAAIADLLATGEAFDIAVELDPSVSIKAAAVRAIDPALDPVTRTRTIYLSLNDPPPSFRLGITVAVTLSKPIAPRIELPATALLSSQGRPQVWIVDPATRKVALREVTVAPRSPPDKIAILIGIAPGERVVAVGVHSLTPGEVVKIPEEGIK